VKIIFYCETKWAFGLVHSALCTQLQARGWTAYIKDWAFGYVIADFQAEVMANDYIVTPNSWVLVDSYGIPHDKIIFVAHDESDLHKVIKRKGVEEFDRFAGYGVISDTLACSSLTLGIKRPPYVVRYGVDIERYRRPLSDRLTSVGYAADMERISETGVERKRGILAKACAEAAGLRFEAVRHLPFDKVPDFYGTVDSSIMPSLQEGAGLPPLEAAASGRLVIGTPVGHFPRLAYEGLGILAPLEAGAFQRFTTETLIYYRDNPAAYVEKCAAIQEAAKQRDWRYTVADWIELFSSAR
jgi:glycosyltransferase involved in cell wall biosynthesis